MVIDTSVLVAILAQEEDAERFANAIAASESLLLSAATLLEAGVVVTTKFGVGGGTSLDALLRAVKAEIVPFTEDHARLARDAFVRYGKGRHPASLNFGDCFSYALAKASAHALLFKGTDFSQTDLTTANVAGQ